jgi:three-Cys-motif partner protein
MAERKEKVVYLDLFCGPGQHKDGTPSTPLRVLESCATIPKLSRKVVPVFNDRNARHVNALKEEVKQRGYNEKLTWGVKFSNLEVTKDTAVELGRIRLAPTFCFIDPYGYKGLSQDLVRSIIKDRGCDLVVFFHTSGINRNLFNEKERKNLESIFGAKRFAALQRVCIGKARNRGSQIIEAFRDAMSEVGGRYFIAFRFDFPGKRLLSHHLIFLTKVELGFTIMRDVMYKTSIKVDGIANWTYTDGAESAGEELNLAFIGPMADLKRRIFSDIPIKGIKFGALYGSYNAIALLYVRKNLIDAISILEREKLLTVMRVTRAGRRSTIIDDDLILRNG